MIITSPTEQATAQLAKLHIASKPAPITSAIDPAFMDGVDTVHIFPAGRNDMFRASDVEPRQIAKNVYAPSRHATYTTAAFSIHSEIRAAMQHNPRFFEGATTAGITKWNHAGYHMPADPADLQRPATLSQNARMVPKYIPSPHDSSTLHPSPSLGESLAYSQSARPQAMGVPGAHQPQSGPHAAPLARDPQKSALRVDGKYVEPKPMSVYESRKVGDFVRAVASNTVRDKFNSGTQGQIKIRVQSHGKILGYKRSPLAPPLVTAKATGAAPTAAPSGAKIDPYNHPDYPARPKYAGVVIFEPNGAPITSYPK